MSNQLRTKKANHSYKVYLCMVLDTVKRNHWLNREAKYHLNRMNQYSHIIALETKAYA